VKTSEYVGRSLVPGSAHGEILFSDAPLSFWMGVDPTSGEIIDRHHPLCGENLTGKILALPGGRGSCSGSCGLVELLMSGRAPAALIFESDEPILTLGALVADEFFGRSIPVASIGSSWFSRLASARRLVIAADRIAIDGEELRLVAAERDAPALILSDADKAMLSGAEGQARQSAMRIVKRFAEIVGADALIDVEKAHIDCCFYTGPAGLDFAERIASWGGKVKVPTTTNAASVDRSRWRTQGVDPSLGLMSDRVAAAYVGMGAQPSFTCAPYLLDGAPRRGQQIAWGESNAVAFANSVLGARTMKYPDFLDVCVALAGRAPRTASHTDEGRRATLHIDVERLAGFDDALYPLLGYCVGHVAGYDIPVITGFEDARPTSDDLKAFSAAFATTSGSPMFHMVGVTPEAATLEEAVGGARVARRANITRADLHRSWRELNSAGDPKVGLVSLGNPHFSLTEIARTAELCRGRRKARDIRLAITCGRDVYASARKAGFIAELEAFGAEFLNDTCWCMVDRRQTAGTRGAIMTNSAKFAHYGPGITDKSFHFGSLSACVDAACAGANQNDPPVWLAAAAGKGFTP
jgi:predicted aconitase/predicted aconitase with swiveling domain